jgi:hypothetical protein
MSQQFLLILERAEDEITKSEKGSSSSISDITVLMTLLMILCPGCSKIILTDMPTLHI